MKKLNAFSLIELLITISVLMILISIASPAYNQLFAKQALVASGERLYQFLVLAKSQSIKYNKKVYVHFCQQGSSQEWRMAMSEINRCDCFVQDSCLINGLQKNMSLSDGKLVFTSQDDITFTRLQASYSPMRFSVNAGSITLSDNYGHKLKVIQSTMRLRMCSPDREQLGYTKC
jgi:type IV fimbrial biogenesis protein FimT